MQNQKPNLYNIIIIRYTSMKTQNLKCSNVRLELNVLRWKTHREQKIRKFSMAYLRLQRIPI